MLSIFLPFFPLRKIFTDGERAAFRRDLDPNSPSSSNAGLSPAVTNWLVILDDFWSRLKHQEFF